MESLRIRQDVTLVFIITELLKERLMEEYAAAAEEVQRQIDQFDFRARHALAELQRTDLNRAMAARQQIDAEKQRLEAVKREIEENRRSTEKLEIGSEYPRGTLEGLVDVQVGDDLFSKIAGVQIVVKDGKIVEIRQQVARPEDVIIPQPQILQPGQ